MKTRIKKLAAIVMTMTMTMAGTVNMAWAGTSASEQIAGYTVWGNLERGSTSASAITGCGGNSSKVSEVWAYYGNGKKTYKSRGTASSLNNPTVATVTVKVSDAQVVGAKGLHTVSVAQATWHGLTSDGAIFDNAEEK